MEKQELNAEINGLPFKTIIWSDNKGVCKVKESPKIIDSNIHISGCHMFRDNPEQNHYDHFEGGSKWKDYSLENNYPFIFEPTCSGVVLLI